MKLSFFLSCHPEKNQVELYPIFSRWQKHPYHQILKIGCRQIQDKPKFISQLRKNDLKNVSVSKAREAEFFKNTGWNWWSKSSWIHLFCHFRKMIHLNEKSIKKFNVNWSFSQLNNCCDILENPSFHVLQLMHKPKSSFNYSLWVFLQC